MHLVGFTIEIRSMYLYLFISECTGIQTAVSLFKRSEHVQSRRYTNVTSEMEHLVPASKQSAESV